MGEQTGVQVRRNSFADLCVTYRQKPFEKLQQWELLSWHRLVLPTYPSPLALYYWGILYLDGLLRLSKKAPGKVCPQLAVRVASEHPLGGVGVCGRLCEKRQLAGTAIQRSKLESLEGAPCEPLRV